LGLWYNTITRVSYFDMIKIKSNNHNFPIKIKKDEGGYYFGVVSGVQGCHTQAKTLPLLRKRLDEAFQLCVEVSGNEFSDDFLLSIERSEVDCHAGYVKKLKSFKELSK